MRIILSIIIFDLTTYGVLDVLVTISDECCSSNLLGSCRAVICSLLNANSQILGMLD